MTRPRPYFVALVLAGLVLAVPTPLADAQSPGAGVVTWDYTLSVEDAARGLMRARIDFSGTQGVVERFGFRTQGHAYKILSIDGPDGSVTQTADGVNVWAKGRDPWVSFVVDVRKDANRAGHGGTPGSARSETYTSYLSPEWGVIKADAFALTFNYTFFEARPPVFRARVHADLPSGWSLATPWRNEGDGWALPGSDVLLRGFLALGPLFTDSRIANGHEFRYARIGAAPAIEPKIFRYLENAYPYYRATYGAHDAPATLVIAAPDPMFDGGLADGDSLYIDTASDLRILAHEYAHTWQRFAVNTALGSSAIWFNEGDADLQGTLSLVATGDWSIAEANAWIDRTTEGSRTSRMRVADVTYGSADEREAYRKGVVLTQGLDALISQSTGGAKGLPDLMRSLNARYEVPSADRPDPLGNAELLEALNILTNWDAAPFFHMYVYGMSWPEARRVAAEPRFMVTDIRFEPDRPREGTIVHAHVDIENRGLARGTSDVPLSIGNAFVGTQSARLDIGGATTLEFTVKAPAPGTHVVRALSKDGILHVVTPPHFEVARISILPIVPRVGAPIDILAYIENAGEDAGQGTVTLYVDGAYRDEKQVGVRGNTTTTTLFSIIVRNERTVRVEIEVGLEGARDVRTATFIVQAADRDRDGVPDSLDSYPDNPKFTEQSAAAAVENATGLPPWVVGIIAGAVIGGVASLAFIGLRRPRVPPGAT